MLYLHAWATQYHCTHVGIIALQAENGIEQQSAKKHIGGSWFCKVLMQ